jgi:hypothetical protein
VEAIQVSQGSGLPNGYTDYVAAPHILWHNKVTLQNRSWTVSGNSFTSSTSLPPSTEDHSWKMVGTADFNGDGQPDIVWEDPNADAHKVWFMNGTTKIGEANFQVTGDINWRVVGVGDFNGDGKGDLLWQHPSYDYAYIWFLNGTTMLSNCPLTATQDLNWRIVSAIGGNQFASGTVVYWHQATGQYYLWYLNGCQNASTQPIANAQGQWVINKDHDFRVVGYWDMNSDQSPDLLLRHSTLGVNGVWYLRPHWRCLWAQNGGRDYRF